MAEAEHEPSELGFYDRKQIRDLTTLSTVTLWRMQRRGEFPKSHQLSRNRVGWPVKAVNAWLTARSAANEREP